MKHISSRNVNFVEHGFLSSTLTLISGVYDQNRHEAVFPAILDRWIMVKDTWRLWCSKFQDNRGKEASLFGLWIKPVLRRYGKKGTVFLTKKKYFYNGEESKWGSHDIKKHVYKH